ncbi:YebC/PmpR family DNA-binding transcriptional regulator [Patescibacteria group bacterium]
MSGHSKWSTIKHQKAITDKKRGNIFSKVAKVITVAVKEGGGGDPDINAKLRLAIEQAKSVNMPKDNIKRAIERGLGKGEGSNLQTVIYEGYGPEKTAVIVEAVTDNKNRTGAEIKTVFDRGGGGLGAPGSALYLFSKKGLILVEKSNDLEEQMLSLIDLGAEDVEDGESSIEVYTNPSELDVVKNKITKAGFKLLQADIIYKPNTLISIQDPDKQNKLTSFLEKLEDLDDVQNVYCNLDFILKDND